MRKKSLLTPLTVILCLMWTGFVLAEEMSGFRVMKPILLRVTPKASEVKVEGFTFAYDYKSDTYTMAVVNLRNPSGRTVKGLVHIVCYDAEGTIIAEGVTNVTVASMETVTARVELSWLPERRMEDLAYATVGFTEETK